MGPRHQRGGRDVPEHNPGPRAKGPAPRAAQSRRITAVRRVAAPADGAEQQSRGEAEHGLLAGRDSLDGISSATTDAMVLGGTAGRRTTTLSVRCTVSPLPSASRDARSGGCLMPVSSSRASRGQTNHVCLPCAQTSRESSNEAQEPTTPHLTLFVRAAALAGATRTLGRTFPPCHVASTNPPKPPTIGPATDCSAGFALP